MQLIESKVLYEADHHGVYLPVSISQTFSDQTPLERVQRDWLISSSNTNPSKTFYFPWLHLGRPHMLRKEIVQSVGDQEVLNFTPFMSKYSELIYEMRTSLASMKETPDKIIAKGVDIVGSKHTYLTLLVEETPQVDNLKLFRRTFIDLLKEFLQSYGIVNPDLFLNASAVLQYQSPDVFIPRIPMGPGEQYKITENILIPPIELTLNTPDFINIQFQSIH